MNSLEILQSITINKRRVTRNDYFLIWGHGMRYKDEILKYLRNKKDIEILKIIKHKIDDISNFVDIIYSYDYAPIEHLRDKTKYLMNTPTKVLFVFFKNLNAEEVLVGEGDFRHIECRNIKKFKEEIRDLYNPRENGKRTEYHVVHASDNELQTDMMLKYLGFLEGVNIFEQANKIIKTPCHLKYFDKFELKNISTDDLRCNILFRDAGEIKKKTVKIEDTPHYHSLLNNSSDYTKYIKEFGGEILTDDHYLEKLITIKEDLLYAQGSNATSYIITRKAGDNRYIILDGVHRASALKINGESKLIVLIIK